MGGLFSHPRDYTPVCTTGSSISLRSALSSTRQVKVVGLSVDSLEEHHGWAGDIEDVTGHALNFPLVADLDRSVAEAYDMIHPAADNTATVRSVFVIGPDKRVKLTLTYPRQPGATSKKFCASLTACSARVNQVATANWEPGMRSSSSPP